MPRRLPTWEDAVNEVELRRIERKPFEDQALQLERIADSLEALVALLGSLADDD